MAVGVDGTAWVASVEPPPSTKDAEIPVAFPSSGGHEVAGERCNEKEVLLAKPTCSRKR